MCQHVCVGVSVCVSVYVVCRLCVCTCQHVCQCLYVGLSVGVRVQMCIGFLSVRHLCACTCSGVKPLCGLHSQGLATRVSVGLASLPAEAQVRLAWAALPGARCPDRSATRVPYSGGAFPGAQFSCLLSKTSCGFFMKCMCNHGSRSSCV